MTAFFASAIMAVPVVIALAFAIPNRKPEEYLIGYFVLAILFVPLCNSWFKKESKNER